MLKTFGALKKGHVFDRVEATATKLVKLGHAVLDGVEDGIKEVKDLASKEFKVGKRNTK